jgi:hypothetical protein
VVTSGLVTLAPAGVTNTNLANSTISFAGNAAGSVTQAVALGGTLTIGNGDTHAGTPLVQTTAVGTNALNIAIRLATVSAPGVASFASGDFTVTAGAVGIIAKNLDSLTDVVVGSPAAGQTLVYSPTAVAFVNRPTYFLYTSGAASVTHTVAHNLGQKYCNVTVVDGGDDVVIPQSIVFNSATQLTVTFTSAIDCKVIVMGVNQG